MIVLDTNVLSELMRPEPEGSVLRWLGEQPAARVFTTSITQAEILHGIVLARLTGFADHTKRDSTALGWPRPC